MINSYPLLKMEIHQLEEARSYYKRKLRDDMGLFELIERIIAERKVEAQALIEAVDTIQDERLREIARFRIIDNLTFAQIAEKSHYSPVHVQRLWEVVRCQWRL